MIQYKIGTNSIDWIGLLNLYGEVGLFYGYGKKKDLEKIKGAFLGSYKVVTVWDKEQIIGAGRLISDGLVTGMINDIGVLVQYQKRGIGKGIIETLVQGNENLFIHLTSTFGNEEFYKKLGFKKHKTAYAKYPQASDYLED